MTLRSSDLQSDSDLDSIRNSCDVFFELSEINRGPVNSDFRPPSATSVWIDGFIGRPLHCIALVENNPAKLTFGLDFCENEKTSTVLISTKNKEEVETVAEEQSGQRNKYNNGL